MATKQRRARTLRIVKTVVLGTLAAAFALAPGPAVPAVAAGGGEPGNVFDAPGAADPGSTGLPGAEVDLLRFLPGFGGGDGALFYRNPVQPDIADPRVLRASDGMYYLYPTGWEVYSSPDLVHWTHRGTALSRENIAYAGELEAGDPGALEYRGKFYLFYAYRVPNKRYYSSVAIADNPLGPFVDSAEHPRHDFGYSTLDSIAFVDDDGKAYLYYSWNLAPVGNHRESRIYGVELSEDLLSPVGEPVLLLKPDQLWEGACDPNCPDGAMRWNEAPFMMKHNGKYYLMYSANAYSSRRYSVGYAVSDHPLGPFVKYEGNPVLHASYPEVSGTGRNTVAESPDGSEWFIAYHSHMDPQQAGARRQLAIDRMGFRDDGSIYVNGPTLTPQPMPSGSTMWSNIAREAHVAASSEAAGFPARNLVDGEFYVSATGGARDWVAGERGDSWVMLSWDEPRTVTSVLLYNSGNVGRRVRSGRLSMSSGWASDLIRFPTEPGAAAIVDVPASEVTWIRFEVNEAAGEQPGLSEIMVLGLPRPLEVRLDWNGETVYKGTEWPDRLPVPLDRVRDGVNTFVAEVTDAAGKVGAFTVHVPVARVSLSLAGESARLSGAASLAMATIIPQAEIALAEVRIVPARGAPTGVAGERGGTGEGGRSGPNGVSAGSGEPVAVLFTGAALPERLELDTLSVDDGEYEIVASVRTRSGAVYEARRRVVIDNWRVLNDPLLPPIRSPWFGTVQRTLAIEVSDGWRYETGDAEAFFGDGDRMAAEPGRTAHMTWELDGLSAFEAVVYAEDEVGAQALRFETSHDGRAWTQVPHRVRVLGRSDAGWAQVRIEGDLPAGASAKLLRLTVSGADGAVGSSEPGGALGGAAPPAGAPALQIGELTLKARN